MIGRKALHFLLFTWLLSFSGTLLAADAQVKSVRIWNSPEGSRFVFDLDRDVRHKVFTLENPHRLVIDLSDARLATSFARLKLAGTPVKGLRSGARHGDDLRLVLDLRERVAPKSILLKPNREYGHRLVVDLDPVAARTPARRVAKPVARAPSGNRDVVVAIDAGHGGEDPGARGPRGTTEKEVVLAIARRLARLIDAEPGMRAVLVRDGDYYVGLRKRMEIARRKQADLFISVHADAVRNRKARGSSVYVLSNNGASSEAARWLADKENASDFVGGVRLEGRDDMLASVLLDLAQSASSEASREVAGRVLGGLARVGNVHKHTVQHAAFVVLKSPDIPSILVETAFISNPKEEKKLRSSRYRQQLAQAIHSGVRSYFYQHPPPGTALAARRRHVIERGDTLARIAQRYAVSVKALRSVNNIAGDKLLPGQVLRIPGGRDS